MVDDLRGNS